LGRPNPLNPFQESADGSRPPLPTLELDTLAVHSGRPKREGATPLSPPIEAASTWIYETAEALDAPLGGGPGFVYARYGNPTVAAFEAAVAALEGAAGAVAYSSGMAAIHAAILASGVRAGETVLVSRDVYGSTVTLVEGLLAPLGLRACVADFTDPERLGQVVRAERPRVILFEILTNPLLHVIDPRAAVTPAREVGAVTIADNTVTTPLLCRPLALGADLVVHSATKYLSGHGDVTAGVVAAGEAWLPELRRVGRLAGATLSPFEAFLALRGLRTLPLRLRRQEENAAGLAERLAGNRHLRKVNYPGLPDHPANAAARELLPPGRFGAMLSFELAGGGRARVLRFMDALRLVTLATTLGDLYSELLYPAMASHRFWTPQQRAEAGISDELVRLSVGIEDLADIAADVEQALETSGSPLPKGEG
jgi:cystathionine gamma-synthase/methionine-gamma-lyase